MQYWLSYLGKILVLTLVLTLLGCVNHDKNGWVKLKAPDDHKPGVMIEGVVHFLPIEGGLFVIRSANGKQYHPIHLPKTFQLDGLHVQAHIQELKDVMSVGMVGPVIELLDIRKLPNKPETSIELFGPIWKLTDLGGVDALEGTPATIQFIGQDEVAGNASCNRFHGKVTIDNTKLTFGHLATTRKFCINEKVMQQERLYLLALEGAERYEIKGQVLYLYSTHQLQPLRFVVLTE